LKDIKKISAANMVNCGDFVIGKSIEDLIYEIEMKKEKQRQRNKSR
jgi:hypothetical protein